jgi:hypothetical protein
MKGRTGVLLAGLAACRIGGPTADPDEYVAFPDAASHRKSPSTPPAGDDGPSASPPFDASTNDLDGGDLDGGDLDATLDALNDTDAPCSSMVTVTVCDPVHNTGCNALEQCDVNPLQTSMPTGQCVFPGGGVEGGICTATFVNESCPPRSTCVDGGCRQLCFCDADCPASQCCSDTSGLPVFNLCGPCVP